MKKMRRSVLALMLVGIMMLLGACGSKDFDAQGLVNSYMELITTGESETYCKLTGASKEEASANYQLMIDSINEAFGSIDGVSEETSQAVTDAFVALIGKANYEVSEATKVDGEDAYELTITIKPIQGAFDNMDSIYEDLLTAIEENPDMTEEELYDMIFQGMANVMNANLENITYGDAQTLDLRVIKEDNTWQLENEEEVGELIGTMIIDQDDLGF